MKANKIFRFSLLFTALVLVNLATLQGQTKSSGTTSGYADASYSGLADNMFLGNWWVLGPVKISSSGISPDQNKQKEVFDKDVFTSVNVQPRENIPPVKIDDTVYKWKPIKCEDGIVDFINLFGQCNYSVAYALAEIKMEAPAKIVIGLGSDDGVKLFLNGTQVHSNWIGRATTPDDDLVILNLKKGSNQILVKVQNMEYGWSFTMRKLGKDMMRKLLVESAGKGNLDNVKLLIDNGVDVNVKNDEGLTAYQYASFKGMEKVTGYLKEKGAKTDIPMPSADKLVDMVLKTNQSQAAPGFAAGIIRNDSLIFAKGYGMANLEYDIPNSEETIFHMASVSKQFTAYSIVLLARQGKLNLEDDIRKYLPWFPDLKETITIRNLLNHTSGIRDQWQLLAISGTRLDDVITQKHIVKILGKQQALNFKPGEKFTYSNSNFTLLAEIVRQVTGQTLRQFTDSAIFKSLGMKNTHFHDDYTEIVKNRSYSYGRKDATHFANSILSYSNEGATSLFTNVKDMSKWIMNFYQPKVGDQNDIVQLTQKGKLTNGKELTYALGIVSDTYKGWRRFSHSGGDAGYRTYITVFPDLKMGFIVFSNLGDFNPNGKANEMADLYVKDTTKRVTPVKEEKRDTSAARLNDISLVKNYLGDYMSDEGISVTLAINNAKLYCRIGNEPQLLVKESDDTYSMFYEPAIKFKFSILGKDTIADVTLPDEKFHMEKYVKKASPDDKELTAYTGLFYCPELDCSYGIQLKDHKLFLTNSKYDDAPLTLVGTEHLLNDYWWINHLMITRNNSNQVTGFEVNSGRIMHLKFNKVE
jgi:CubicO group peptidase (beta-lactamase class C family)